MYFLLFLLFIVLFYIAIRKEGFEPNNLPDMKQLTLYSTSTNTSDERDKFMKTMGKSIYSVYKTVKYERMKNNLWSYCVVYKNGGLYIDETKGIQDTNIFDKPGLIVIPEKNDNLFCDWIFSCSKPNNPILKYVINNCVERILNNEIMDEEKIDYITGNICFTESILKYLHENNRQVFDNVNDFVKYRNKDLTVIEPLNFYKNNLLY